MVIASIIRLVGALIVRWQQRRNRRSQDRRLDRALKTLSPHLRRDIDWPQRDRSA